MIPVFNLVLRVCDMQKCRAFYRDVLNLGAPEIDSPYWVEFAIGTTGRICLELRPEGSTPPMERDDITTWILDSTDDPDIIERLAGADCPVCDEMTHIMGRQVFRCFDPEGNTFYVSVPQQNGEV